jgi:hypothetical protein
MNEELAQLSGSVWINQLMPEISLNGPVRSTILTAAGTEDRATLKSDLSADIGERCSAGQGPHSAQSRYPDRYIVPESDKLALPYA